MLSGHSSVPCFCGGTDCPEPDSDLPVCQMCEEAHADFVTEDLENLCQDCAADRRAEIRHWIDDRPSSNWSDYEDSDPDHKDIEGWAGTD